MIGLGVDVLKEMIGGGGGGMMQNISAKPGVVLVTMIDCGTVTSHLTIPSHQADHQLVLSWFRFIWFCLSILGVAAFFRYAQ